MAACRGADLVVGQDVSIGYGNSEAGGYASSSLSTEAHDIQENGRHLAQVLLFVLGGQFPAALHYLDPLVLKPRSSDGPIQLQA